MYFMCLCPYLFVLEGLHQLRHATEGHGESKVGASVAVSYLNALVAKISLPFCVMTEFILAKDVRYKVSYVKVREGKREVDQCGEGKPHYVSQQEVELAINETYKSVNYTGVERQSYFHCWLG